MALRKSRCRLRCLVLIKHFSLFNPASNARRKKTGFIALTPDDKLEDVLQALHRLRHFLRVEGGVLDANRQSDEQLSVRQSCVKILVDVKLQHRDKLLIPDVKVAYLCY